MSSLKTKKTQSGFTLIEVLMTLLILGIMMIMFQLVSNSVILNKYNRYKEIALRVAENQIQSLRTTSYASLPASGSFNNSLLSSIPSGAGTMTLTQVQTGLTQAVVTVTWRNPSTTANQQIVLSTYIWQYGLGK